MTARAVLLAAALCAAGCAAKKPVTLYDWGEYQDSLYVKYAKPGEFNPETELHRMETQMENTRVHEGRVPPGVRAYAAMLCAATGDEPGARAYLRAEKEAFPESAVFVDGMLERMSK